MFFATLLTIYPGLPRIRTYAAHALHELHGLSICCMDIAKERERWKVVMIVDIIAKMILIMVMDHDIGCGRGVVPAADVD